MEMAALGFAKISYSLTTSSSLVKCQFNMYTVVQSLDDDSDLPELEGSRMLDKSDYEFNSNNLIAKDDMSSTVESVPSPVVAEQLTTTLVDDSKDENDTT